MGIIANYSLKGHGKLGEFIKGKTKLLLKILIVLAAFVAVSLISMLILIAFGIIYFEDGVHLNIELFNSFKNSWYGWVIIILIQVVITTLLSFIPGTSMAFIILIQTLYESAWQAFLITFIGVLVSSSLMYTTGRFGGYAICKRLLGEEDCNKASELLNDKGAVFFPLMMLFPVFPDDALTMIAGTLKMSLNWFIPSIVIGRGIGIATIIFGLGNIPYDKFTTPWHWVGFIALIIALISLVFFLAFKFNKYLVKRRHAREHIDTNE